MALTLPTRWPQNCWISQVPLRSLRLSRRRHASFQAPPHRRCPRSDRKIRMLSQSLAQRYGIYTRLWLCFLLLFSRDWWTIWPGSPLPRVSRTLTQANTWGNLCRHYACIHLVCATVYNVLVQAFRKRLSHLLWRLRRRWRHLVHALSPQNAYRLFDEMRCEVQSVRSLQAWHLWKSRSGGSHQS
jgi:hypothetical protein